MNSSLPSLYARAFGILLLALAALAGPSRPQTKVDSSLAKSRAQTLRHGVNLSHWFAQVYDPKGYTKEHFDTYNTPKDIELIRSLGFDHVRLTVNPQPMFHNGEADHISADYLAMLDSAVKTILDNNLAVVIDIHPDGDFKAKLTNDSFVEQFGDYWRALAKHYSSTNPEKVFFEILNEPEMRDRYRWNGIEAYLVNAIREGAPQHTIIVEGARWADDDDLLFLEPVRDANVIYNFHYYEPHLFTHQGAAWGDPWWHHLSELPYPSTPENVQDALTRVPDAAHRLEIARYGAERWNPERIDADFAQIAAWAKKWDVPVVCNEFGVYRKAARPEDRAAWLRDVRTLLEKHGIGWTMWDYAGGFGVVTRDNGQTTVDPVTVKALGLQPATNK